MQNDLLHPTPSAPVAEVPDSLWWESRSGDDLKEILQRGFLGGEMFEAANREMRRRIAALDKAEEEARAASAAHRTSVLKWILIAFAAAILGAGLLGYLT